MSRVKDLARYRIPRRTRGQAKRNAPKPPSAPGLLYLRELNKVRREWHGVVIAALKDDLAVIAGERMDAPLLVPVLRTAVAGLRSRIVTLFTHERLSGFLGKVGENTAEHARKEVSRVIGIPLKSVVPEDRLKSFRSENVDLIRSLAGHELDRVTETLAEAQTSGLRVEELAERVQEQFGLSDARAALIARDQTLKLNSQIASERMTAVGITEYVWVTSKDERVRDEHAALDGKTFSFNDPPVVSKNGDTANPGQYFQCRCTASPVVDNLF